jgi:hypothetical protein
MVSKLVETERKSCDQGVAESDTANLAKAVKRIYAQYGDDLSAFFRDALKENQGKQNNLNDDNFKAFQP